MNTLNGVNGSLQSFYKEFILDRPEERADKPAETLRPSEDTVSIKAQAMARSLMDAGPTSELDEQSAMDALASVQGALLGGGANLDDIHTGLDPKRVFALLGFDD